MRLLKTLPLFLLLAFSGRVSAQSPSIGNPVNQVGGPPPQPYVNQIYYDGSNNLQYICKALQIQPAAYLKSYSVAANTLTNIVVTGNTTATATTVNNHNLVVGTRLVVTGSATTTLNGTFSVTSVTSNTLVFTVPSTTSATYTDMTIQTSWPALTDPVWTVQVFTNPSNLLGSSYFAQPTGLPQFGSSTPNSAKCSDRATY